MKKILCVFLLISGSITLQAQDSFLGLSMGASIPLGEYATADELFSSGYAGTNFVLNFDGSYVIIPFLGIGGTFSFGSNFADEESIKKTILGGLSTKYPVVNFPAFQDASFTTEIGRWTYVNLMVGPNISIPLEFLQFDLRALGGISFITPPDWKFTITWTDEQVTSTQSANLVNFGYVLGGAIRFGARESTGIRLAADYYSAKPSMKILTEHPLITPEQEEVDFDLQLKALSVTLGLCFNF